jgi:hypothetical protein
VAEKDEEKVEEKIAGKPSKKKAKKSGPEVERIHVTPSRASFLVETQGWKVVGEAHGMTVLSGDKKASEIWQKFGFSKMEK